MTPDVGELGLLFMMGMGPPCGWAVVTKMSALKTYVVDLKKKKVNVIRSKCSLGVPFLTFLASHTKRSRCDQMDPPHVNFRVKLCLHAKVLGSILFSSKSTLFGFFI